MVKVRFYFNNNGNWNTELDGQTMDIPLPKLGDKIKHKGKTFEVVDIDEEYGVYDIYLE